MVAYCAISYGFTLGSILLVCEEESEKCVGCESGRSGKSSCYWLVLNKELDILEVGGCGNCVYDGYEDVGGRVFDPHQNILKLMR